MHIQMQSVSEKLKQIEVVKADCAKMKKTDQNLEK